MNTSGTSDASSASHFQPHQKQLFATPEASSHSGTTSREKKYGQNLPSSARAPKTNIAGYAAILILANGIPPLPEHEVGYWYAIPEHMSNQITAGLLVHIPFGRQPALAGLVLHIQPHCPAHLKGKTIRPISDILSTTPLVTHQQWDYFRWIADYYVTPLSEVVSTAIPAKLLQQPKSIISLTEHFQPETLTSFHPKAQECLQLLIQRNKPLSPRFLARELKLTSKSFRSLSRQLSDAGCIQQQLDWQSPPKAAHINVIQVTSSTKSAKTPRQQDVLTWLRTHAKQPTPQKQVMQALSVTSSVLDKLIEQGLLTRTQAPLSHYRGVLPSTSQGTSNTGDKQLTAQQAQCTDIIWERIINANSQTQKEADQQSAPQREFVLHGVTGSGKTEVYIELTRRAMAEGKQVLFLVPEISLTAPLANRFIDVFGKENILIWHSNLSDGERTHAWQAVSNGNAPIVIGARSAMLLPHKELSLIMMDEAHDGSYKQESPAPRYNAHTLAQYWAEHHNTTLVLGSATPDLSHYYHAQKNGTLLQLTERFGNHALANVHVVDARQRITNWTPPEQQQPVINEAEAENNEKDTSAAIPGHSPHAKKNPLRPPSLITQDLYDGIQHALDKGEQAMVLMNRRGFYTLVQCVDCQQFVQCPSCSVSLTYHKGSGIEGAAFGHVHCHHCGYIAEKPSYCPHCAGRRVQLQGVGTQRVEDELAQCFPNARIARLDRDIAQRKYATQQVIHEFTHHQADILVGTQMIAKGLDIHNVTQVGVIQADSSFVLPDYRASERGFQLLTQVAGRAGRGEKEGHVYLQSWNTEHPVLNFASQQAYEPFYDFELAIRKQFQFPPFSQLFRFIVMGEDEQKTRQHAELLKHHLERHLSDMLSLTAEGDQKLLILGPAPCAIERLNNRYRYHVLIKNPFGQPVHQAIGHFFKNAPKASAFRVILDVDAQSLL